MNFGTIGNILSSHIARLDDIALASSTAVRSLRVIFDQDISSQWFNQSTYTSLIVSIVLGEKLEA